MLTRRAFFPASVMAATAAAQRPSRAHEPQETQEPAVQPPLEEPSKLVKGARFIDPTMSAAIIYPIYHFLYAFRIYKVSYKPLVQAGKMSEEELRQNLADSWVNTLTDTFTRMLVVALRLGYSSKQSNIELAKDEKLRHEQTAFLKAFSKILSTSSVLANTALDRYLTNALHDRVRESYKAALRDNAEYQNLPWNIPFKTQLALWSDGLKEELKLVRKKLQELKDSKAPDPKEIKTLDKTRLTLDLFLCLISYLLPLVDLVKTQSPSVNKLTSSLASNSLGNIPLHLVTSAFVNRDVNRRLHERGDDVSMEQSLIGQSATIIANNVYYGINLLIFAVLHNLGLGKLAKTEFGYYHLEEFLTTLITCIVNFPLELKIETDLRKKEAAHAGTPSPSGETPANKRRSLKWYLRRFLKWYFQP